MCGTNYLNNYIYKLGFIVGIQTNVFTYQAGLKYVPNVYISWCVLAQIYERRRSVWILLNFDKTKLTWRQHWIIFCESNIYYFKIQILNYFLHKTTSNRNGNCKALKPITYVCSNMLYFHDKTTEWTTLWRLSTTKNYL